MEIRAMDVEELGTVKARALVLQWRAEVDVRGLPVAPDDAVWKEADVTELLPESERPEHLDAVRRHLDAGADLAERGGALEDARLDAELAKGTR
jgi:hypothetical protein